MENNNFYVKKTYTFLIQHGLESIVDRLLKNEKSIKVIDGENGSQIKIIEQNGN